MLSVAASSRGAYRRRGFRRVLIGPADRRVTGHAGVAVVAEVDRVLGISSALDGAVGSIKSRRRGVSAGGLLLSMASAHMTGADFLVGMDHRRADTPGSSWNRCRRRRRRPPRSWRSVSPQHMWPGSRTGLGWSCLLYTSDAADEEDSV